MLDEECLVCVAVQVVLPRVHPRPARETGRSGATGRTAGLDRLLESGFLVVASSSTRIFAQDFRYRSMEVWNFTDDDIGDKSIVDR
jgi:hypothetical protein